MAETSEAASITLGKDDLTEISTATKIWICGVPRNEYGEYYCPYCKFASDDIEDFAISMCWDCLYEEENETRRD